MPKLDDLIIKIKELQELHGCDLEDPAVKKQSQDIFLSKHQEVQNEINILREV